MECILKFAEISFVISSEREIELDEVILPFVQKNVSNHNVRVHISWNWEEIQLPESGFIGEDIINSYYESNGCRYCITKGGHKGHLACTVYNENMYEFYCHINEEPFLYPPKNVGAILRMIPIKEIFIHYGILFLHSSQISYKNKGILFTAPSGTGKTTQAKLWNKYRNAQIICNDRTMIRKVGDVWYTYGYPIDGSEPVRSSAVNELASIVVIVQAPHNNVEQLGVTKAVTSLMSQLVIDVWNAAELSKAMELLLDLIEEKKVCLLQCTKDEEAVDILEKFLVESQIF